HGVMAASRDGRSRSHRRRPTAGIAAKAFRHPGEAKPNFAKLFEKLARAATAGHQADGAVRHRPPTFPEGDPDGVVRTIPPARRRRRWRLSAGSARETSARHIHYAGDE